ncbi:hypothetical protein C2E23DRAFT_285853 [Lenzites betulinus]|nr:hypothetical protein C2E23DRAFT_285853 [Lenzites betulinus]
MYALLASGHSGVRSLQDIHMSGRGHSHHVATSVHPLNIQDPMFNTAQHGFQEHGTWDSALSSRDSPAVATADMHCDAVRALFLIHALPNPCLLYVIYIYAAPSVPVPGTSGTSTPLLMPDAQSYLFSAFGDAHEKLVALHKDYPDPSAYKSVRQVTAIISIAHTLGLSKSCRTVAPEDAGVTITWDDVISVAPGLPVASFKNIRTSVEKIKRFGQWIAMHNIDDLFARYGSQDLFSQIPHILDLNSAIHAVPLSRVVANMATFVHMYGVTLPAIRW